MRKRLHLLLVAAACALTGCRAPQPAAVAPSAAPDSAGGTQAKVFVSATIFPIADVARSLGGAAFEVQTLVPSGGNPHTFELTPEKARQLADSKVILRIGPGLDDWLDKLTSSTAGKVVTLMDHTQTIRGASDHHHEHGQPHEHEAEHGGELAANPHIWLDPIRMRDDLAPAIAAALTAALPAEKPGIDQRLQLFQQQLTELDADIRKLLAGVGSKRFIAEHHAWEYFNERYGLELVAVIEEMPGTDPSAKWLKSVIELAQREQVRAVFSEVQLNAAAGRAVAQEAKVRFGMLDDLGGEGVSGRDSYAGLLRYDAQQIAEGLKP